MITSTCQNGRHIRCSNGLLSGMPCECRCHDTTAAPPPEQPVTPEQIITSLRDWSSTTTSVSRLSQDVALLCQAYQEQTQEVARLNRALDLMQAQPEISRAEAYMLAGEAAP